MRTKSMQSEAKSLLTYTLQLSTALCLTACDLAKPGKGGEASVTQEQVETKFEKDDKPSEVIEKIPASAQLVTDSLSVSFKTDLVLITAETLPTISTGLESLLIGLSEQTDLQLHIISSAPFVPPAKIDPAKLGFIITPVAQRQLIGNLNSFFDGQYSANYTNQQGASRQPLAFRSDARLELLVVSGDDAQGQGFMALDFNPKIKTPMVINSATALPETVESGSCRVERVSVEYSALAKQSGGQQIDICSRDWSAITKRLVTSMVAQANSFALSKTPKSPSKIEVLVNGASLATGTWTYNPEKNSVSIVRQSEIKNGLSVTIKYQPKSED